MSVPLLLLTDGRFPAGGYAHSGGLEEAVAEGLEVDGVPAFLDGRLRHVAAAESTLAVGAARAARAGSLGTLLALDVEADARCPSPPLRAASHRLGSQLLRSASVAFAGDGLIGAYAAASGATPRPVAFGVVAAAAGLADAEVAKAYLYEDAMTVATAAVRLLPVDSAAAAGWALAAAPLVHRLAREAAAAGDDPRGWPGGFAPCLERRSLAHARREGRLFAS
jgi:urease accessory protein